MVMKPECLIESLSKRPWYRLHFSTWAAILAVLGIVSMLEMPGETQGTFYADGFGAGGPCSLSGETFLHGWPWIFLDRNAAASNEFTSRDPEEAPWSIPRAWNLLNGVREFSPFNLCLNLLVCASTVGFTGFCIEWRRRRHASWSQFTLRELFLLIIFCAGVLSWWRVNHNQHVLEEQIASRITKDLPGSILDWQYRGPKILAKILGTKRLSDFSFSTECVLFSTCHQPDSENDRQKFERCVADCANFVHLEKIEFWSEDDMGTTLVTDETLLKLATMRNLQEIVVPYSAVTDSGAETLSHFTAMRTLNLSDAKVTRIGIERLERMPALEKLYLAGKGLDDSVAETISRMRNLTDLSLRETKITDKSIPFLEQLSRLKYIDIFGTDISEEGYRRLKGKLPNCDVYYRDQSLEGDSDQATNPGETPN
jgi:hypothetical protein